MNSLKDDSCNLRMLEGQYPTSRLGLHGYTKGLALVQYLEGPRGSVGVMLTWSDSDQPYEH